MECIVCGNSAQDAALGRAVRRMPDGSGLITHNGAFGVELIDGSLYVGDTPEAALKAAGLMEVKK